MNISPKRATCDENNLWVELNDGRTLGVPLAWFPRLLAATPQQREACELSPRGIHWETRSMKTSRSRGCSRERVTSAAFAARLHERHDPRLHGRRSATLLKVYEQLLWRDSNPQVNHPVTAY